MIVGRDAIMIPWTSLSQNADRMEQLRLVFAEFGSDKPCHSYERAYQAILPFNEDAKILEIGISNYSSDPSNGASSLFSWKKLYPKSTVIGVDRDPNRMVSVAGIRTFVADQANRISLTALSDELDEEEFDIIIDDASHIFSNSERTFNVLRWHLASGGKYIIEDIARDGKSDGWQQTASEFESMMSSKGLNGMVVDCRPEYPEDRDSLMAVIEK